MKKLIIVSYIFPPAGGAGVQRVLKYVKYLPVYDWQPVVFTPAKSSVPVLDESHFRDFPPELIVERLTSLEPSAAPGGGGGGGAASGGIAWRLKSALNGLAFPDRHVAWLPTALPLALARARAHRAEAVLVSAPPFSSFLLGEALSRMLGLPLVLDFRDEWSGFFSKGFSAHGGGGFWRAMVRRNEARLVGRASAVIGTTDGMTRRLERLYGHGEAGKFVWIPNGYDPADFSFMEQDPPVVQSAPHRLHMLYAGTVFESHPLEPLWRGLELLLAEERSRLDIDIVGRVVGDQRADPGLEGLSVNVLPYEPHREIVHRMASAQSLVLSMAALPGLERMVSAKLYEYMAVKRPVLCLSPPGASAQIVEAAESGVVVHPGDSEGIARAVRAWLQTPPAGLERPPVFFSRKRLTRELAILLDRVALPR